MRKSNSLGQTSLPRFQRASILAAILPAIFALLCVLPIEAAQLKKARVSQVIRDVKLLPAQAAPRPATVSDEVRDGTAVRTGVESRAELTFTDQTLARLGANTIFSFNEGTRNLELSGGAMLLRVPKDAGGARIQTAAVTAAITGTTVLLEYHPDAYIKFIILEGTGRIFRNDRVGESVLLHAGQMLIVNPKGKGLPDPVDVDLDRLIKTSLLINGFPALPSDSLIAREIQEQSTRKNGGELVETNLVIFGGGTLVSLLDPTHSQVLDQANDNETRETRESPTPTPTPTPTMTPTPTPTVTMTPTPTPTPGKSGTPPVITSPDPYVITNGTSIQTDPTITTRGRTDLGTIYHGPAIDGKASKFLFGPTSTFDTSSGFDSHFGDAANSPIAVFKFSSLVLAGNPTISLTNRGVTKLALISVGNLTSGTAPATLTFAGIDSLLLATQNGSITLGSNLAFQGIPTLFVYARGAGKLLTFDSAVSGSTDLVLLSQGGILFNNAFAVTESDPKGSSLNIFFNAGKNLTATNGLTLTLDNSENGDLSGFADISLSAGGNLVANGAAGLSLTIANNDGGQIGAEADLGIFGQGNLTASRINLLLDNGNGGSIATFANLSVEIGGILTTAGDASFVINNGDAGGTIESSATLDLIAASTAIGGNLDVVVGNNDGGSMFSCLMLVDSAGNMTIGGAVSLILDNSAFSSSGYIVGGDIAGDAVMELSAASISTQNGGLVTFLYNDGGGHIGGNSLISANVSGNINAQGNVYFDIENSADSNGNVTLPGGTIDGDAITTIIVGGNLTSSGLAEFSVLNNDYRFLSAGGTIMGNATVVFNAKSLTTGDFFNLLVNDNYGTIGGTASVLGNLSGNLTVGTAAYIHLLNDYGNINGEALAGFVGGAISIGDTLFFQISNQNGVIGGDATLDFTANSLTADSIEADILNNGGRIGGQSSISFNISGAAAVAGDATVQVLADPQTSSTSSIDLDFGSLEVGGTFRSTISGDGNITIAGPANIHADILKIGAFGDNGSLTINGGSLSGDTQLKLYASGSNGMINFNSNVSLNSDSSSVIIAANTVTIRNGVVVTITGDDGVNASVYTNVPNYTGSGGNGSTTGTFAGNGAQTAPLDQAPPFDDDLEAPTNHSTAPTSAPTKSVARGAGAGRGVPIATVADSNALLDLADRIGQSRSRTAIGRAPRQAGKVSLGKNSAAPSRASDLPANLALLRNRGRNQVAVP